MKDAYPALQGTTLYNAVLSETLGTDIAAVSTARGTGGQGPGDISAHCVNARARDINQSKHQLDHNAHLGYASELFLREATPVVVVDAVPALGVAVRAVLCIAALVVAETLRPTFRVPHGHRLCARGVAGLVTGDPALAGLPAAVAGAEPALLLALFSAPDPPLALGQGVADLRTRLHLAGHKLVRAHAVIEEAPDCGSVSLKVREECVAGVPHDAVLLLAAGPILGGGVADEEVEPQDQPKSVPLQSHRRAAPGRGGGRAG
eukprot:CAMPEP_0204528184 /NCGR_PEP_ID=MMETSP0661-20131031/9385_1 /ASSEMBLY_ACC=CAM_ASM_000606 /TAXON_ID=109239 /ORGANISM="Alexandrium margalefi, Strain AMGDE01CS-322" /LENGTH=261 /DNA_ID=CAMNT_0051534145 /DNA_START=194 /DNA_END=976 /DNA_ORIENTATION=-